MKKIVNWIENEGVEGYLTWDDDEMKIQLADPNAHTEEKKRARQAESEIKKYEKLSKKSKNIPVNCK